MIRHGNKSVSFEFFQSILFKKLEALHRCTPNLPGGGGYIPPNTHRDGCPPSVGSHAIKSK